MSHFAEVILSAAQSLPEGGLLSPVPPWFSGHRNEYSEAVLECFEAGEAFVPAIWPLEMWSVLPVAERKKRLSESSVIRQYVWEGACPSLVDVG